MDMVDFPFIEEHRQEAEQERWHTQPQSYTRPPTHRHPAHQAI
jgi:hypothetical protein